MKKNKLLLNLAMAVVGALALSLGGFVLTDEKVKMVSGLFIGLGAALFCIGIGNFISSLVMSKTESEEFARKKNIEVNDERNIRIREKVGSKINQVMIYAISVIVLAMGFMQVSVIAIILVASLLLLELVLAIVLTNYYSKRI